MKRRHLGCLVSVFFIFSITISVYAADGLVFAMTFEEGSGDQINDLSGNGNHGEVVGNVDWGAGSNGGGFHLDGATHIVVPNAEPLSSLTHPMTVGCWINPDEVGGWRSIIEMDGAAGWKIGTHSSGDVVVWTTYHVKDFAATTSIVAGEWTHIAATWDGAEALIYVNGELDASVAGGGVIDVSGEPSLDIGYRRTSESSWYMGNIDDVFIYDKVLSQQELADVLDGLPTLSVEPGNKAAITWGALKR